MKLATLLYIRNSRGEYLLMKRLKEPNAGLMSPPGGKLKTEEAESPALCAVREAHEECLIKSSEKDWKLKGIVTEKNFPGAGNIMIFLMQYKILLDKLPPACDEGEFSFIHPEDFINYEIPHTDRLFIWESVLKEKAEPEIFSLDCTYYPEIKKINF